MEKLFTYLFGLPKSIYINFTCLPLRQAIILPILVSHRTRFRSLTGHIRLESPSLKPGLVKIGIFGTQISDSRKLRTVLTLKGNVVFQGKCHIGIGSSVHVAPQATLTFGDRFNMTSNSHIICHKAITFGKENLFSWNCMIMDTDQHQVTDLSGTVLNANRPIVTHDHVWCGCQCLLLKGTVVGSHVVVGAGSVLSSAYPQNHVMLAGSPAKVVKEHISWK